MPFRSQKAEIESDPAKRPLFDYRCPVCGNEDVFLDVVRLDGEADEGFKARKAELEATAGRIRAERLGVVVVERDVKPE
jgi:hypothetical protein